MKHNNIIADNDIWLNTGVLFAKSGAIIPEWRLLSLISEGKIASDSIKGQGKNFKAKAFFAEQMCAALPFERNEIKKECLYIINDILDKNDDIEKLLDYFSTDDCTHGHSVRVTILATAIAINLELPESEIETIAVGAAIHDSGKIFLQNLVQKKGELSDDEYAKMQQHPFIGYRFSKRAGFQENEARIALLHHERYDGSGYPFHLEKEQIPLGASIVAIADTIDAMRSQRAYKEAQSLNYVLSKIRVEQEKKMIFNPKAFEAAMRIMSVPVVL